MMEFQAVYKGEKAELSSAEMLKLAMAIDTNKDKKVNYLELMIAFSSFDRNIVGLASTSSLMQSMFNTLYQYYDALLKAFQYFDYNALGLISEDDFEKSLKVVNTIVPGQPLHDAQIRELGTHLPQTKDGMIEYMEFLDAFVVVDADQL